MTGIRCRFVVVALAATALFSCSPSVSGSFGKTGFTSSYGFEVKFRKGSKSLMPRGWIIDNYVRHSGRLEPRTDGEYKTTYRFDRNRDGEADTVFDETTYALRFEHEVHDGVIWVRTIPISPRLRSKNLRVLMQTYLDAVAGGSYEAVKLDATNETVVLEKRYAATLVESGPARLAAATGYLATADLANIDQVKVNPNARERRIQLVIVRAPKDRDYSGLKIPVLIVAGYSNIPDDFDEGLTDFHDLLDRIYIGSDWGFEPPEAPPATPPPAPAEPPPASPAAPPT